MKRKPAIAIVGAGSLGSALALALAKTGYAITEIVCHDSPASRQHCKSLARQVRARITSTDQPGFTADIIWICVPDSEIRRCANTLARRGGFAGKAVFHSSGALSSDELDAFRRQGARVASLHPMMTFVRGVSPALHHVPFAIEGEESAVRLAHRIVRDLGGEPFVIAKRHKPAYHAWGAFASPLLVAALVTAEQVAHAAGINGKNARKKMLPIVRQTIQNYAEKGGAAAFSGPIIRGDTQTIRKHLNVLARIPAAKEVYIALARSALRNLPSRDRAGLKKVIG